MQHTDHAAIGIGVPSLIANIQAHAGVLSTVGVICGALLAVPSILKGLDQTLKIATDFVRALRGLPPLYPPAPAAETPPGAAAGPRP